MDAQTSVPEDAPSASRQAPVLIAVVDDDDSVRKALRRLLRASGFAVESFASGAAFLDFVRRVRPACVLLDLHMPGTDGYEVQAGLTRAGADVPVIMITGGTTPEFRARALDLGASAFFAKPIDETKLLDAIRSAIGH